MVDKHDSGQCERRRGVPRELGLHLDGVAGVHDEQRGVGGMQCDGDVVLELASAWGVEEVEPSPMPLHGRPGQPESVAAFLPLGVGVVRAARVVHAAEPADQAARKRQLLDHACFSDATVTHHSNVADFAHDPSRTVVLTAISRP